MNNEWKSKRERIEFEVKDNIGVLPNNKMLGIEKVSEGEFYIYIRGINSNISYSVKLDDQQLIKFIEMLKMAST